MRWSYTHVVVSASARRDARAPFAITVYRVRLPLPQVVWPNEQVGVDLPHETGEVGQLDYLDAGLLQGLRTAAVGEGGRLPQREDHPAQPRRENQVGTCAGAGSAGTARFQRGVDRRPAQVGADHRGLRQRRLLRVLGQAVFPRVPARQFTAVGVDDDRADRVRRRRHGARPGQLDRGEEPAAVRYRPAGHPAPNRSLSAYRSRTTSPIRRTSARVAGWRGFHGNAPSPTNRGARESRTKNGATTRCTSSASPAVRNRVWVPPPPSTTSRPMPRPARSVSTWVRSTGSPASTTTATPSSRSRTLPAVGEA